MDEDLRNVLQELIARIREILDPVAEGIGDQEVRREILLALGLDGDLSSQPLDIPPASLASIDAYREQAAAEADLRAFISLLQDITQVIQALIDLIRSVEAADSDAPPGFVVEEAVSFFLSAITLGYLRVRLPGAYITAKALQLIEEQGLRFGGFIDLIFRTGDYFEDLWGAARDLQTDEDAKAVSDVALFIVGAIIASLIKTDFIYGYDAGPGSTSPLADAASDRALTLRLSGKTKDAEDNTVKASLLSSFVLLPRDHGGPGLLMRFQGDGSVEVPFSDNVSLKLALEAPDLIVYAGEGSHSFPTSTEASFSVGLNYKSTAQKPVIWGDVQGIHLRIGKMGLEGKASVDDYGIKGEVKDSAFVLATESADGFLKTILDAVASGGKLETEFEFNIGYSRKKGFFVGGGMGLMLAIPLHETLGPLSFNTLFVGIAIGERAGKKPGIKLESSLSFGMDLGVLQASVDRIGLAGLVAFDDGEFALDFKPPNGVGLAIDAGAVRGGGFLNFDYERGEYSGGLEIDISGIVTVTALGLITTRMPDGSEGFALLVIISVEFGTPIQLGLGFTLIGVGGLLGLNRTMRLELLAEGIRTGSADSIMFPRNIVANAARIISDLRTFFPTQENTFLVGPMLKLGWGTPTLVSLSLGVIIQIPPGNVAILGVLKLTLPDEDAAVLKLQIAFIGAIEVDKERAWFFATLYDSRVLFMTLEGGMGVLVAWGENANFVISVGGFHPQFDPPPLPFPVPDRLAINILNYPLARIRVLAYFAVTSNTAQFGARAELFFGFDGLSLEGHLAFDALFQFSPFYFIIAISASVSLKVFGAGLFSVRMKGSLEGPTPWRIAGAASVSILFFEVSADFEETWGETRDTTLPARAAMPLVAGELEKAENWTAELPGGSHLMVSLRGIEANDEGLVLHPVGRLRISQRAVPLEITIDKVGNQRTSDANRFHLSVDGGSGLVKQDDSEERFAIAQFQNVDGSRKLSLPAYQSEASGVVLSAEGGQVKSSRLVKRRVRFEMIILDTNFKRFVRPFFDFWINLFSHFLDGAAIGRSALSRKRELELYPFDEKIAVRETPYVVANLRDNTPWLTEGMAFTSEARARESMNEQIAATPKLARELHVIPGHEVTESA
jgi:Family of unknown function (DUF6603)